MIENYTAVAEANKDIHKGFLIEHPNISGFGFVAVVILLVIVIFRIRRRFTLRMALENSRLLSRQEAQYENERREVIWNSDK